MEPDDTKPSDNPTALLSAKDRAEIYELAREMIQHSVVPNLKKALDNTRPASMTIYPRDVLTDLNHVLPLMQFLSAERQEQTAAQMKEYLVSLQSVSAEMNGQIKVMKRESRIMVILAGLTAALTVALVILTIVLITKA